MDSIFFPGLSSGPSQSWEIQGICGDGVRV